MSPVFREKLSDSRPDLFVRRPLLSGGRNHAPEFPLVNLDSLWNCDTDLAACFKILSHPYEGDTDESMLGIEAQMMALGRFLEVDRLAGVAQVEIEHVALSIVGDVVERDATKSHA